MQRTKLKKFIIYTICILVAGILAKNIIKNFSKKSQEIKAAIERDWTEDDIAAKLVEYNIIRKRCYTPDDIAGTLAQEGFDYAKDDEAITSNSLAKILDKDIKPADQPKIPMVTHHVYFSSTINPIQLNGFFIEKIKANFNKLNQLGDWQHILWTNQPDLFPQDIQSIKGVTIKTIAEFKDHILYSYLEDSIRKGNGLRAFFMESSDLLRLMAVQKFGGIYNDMDYEIYNAQALLNLMRKFDFIAGREHTARKSYYGNAFMAAKPNHPVINEAMARMINYDLNKWSSFPDYTKYPCHLYNKFYFKSPPLLTVAYFAKNNLGGNSDIILPSWMLFNVDFARGKNGACGSEVNKEQFIASNNILDKLLVEFNTNFKTKDRVMKDPENPTDQGNDKLNIYYNLDDRAGFPIIGADMFCGSWSRGTLPKKLYHLNWPYVDNAKVKD